MVGKKQNNNNKLRWFWRYPHTDEARDLVFDAQNTEHPQFSEKTPSSDE